MGLLQALKTEQTWVEVIATLAYHITIPMLDNYTVCVNLFDYIGSIISYFVIAFPILAGRYDHMSTADLSSLISEVETGQQASGLLEYVPMFSHNKMLSVSSHATF